MAAISFSNWNQSSALTFSERGGSVIEFHEETGQPASTACISRRPFVPIRYAIQPRKRRNAAPTDSNTTALNCGETTIPKTKRPPATATNSSIGLFRLLGIIRAGNGFHICLQSNSQAKQGLLRLFELLFSMARIDWVPYELIGGTVRETCFSPAGKDGTPLLLVRAASGNPTSNPGLFASARWW